MNYSNSIVLFKQIKYYSLIMFLATSLIAQGTDKEEILVTLKLNNEKIGTVLDTISKQTKLEFAYSGQF